MATKRWLGKAMDVQGVSTWTFADTFAANDKVNVAINSKTLILTLGTDVTTTDVASETAAMINAISATAGRVGANADETRNFGGQQIPEFQEIVASSSGAVLTIKTTAGVPVTIAITVTTAGDGTVGSETVVTAATGKNFFDNADNWSGGSVPGAGDTILFDSGSVDCKYNLNILATEAFNLVMTSGYTGTIGLPIVNPLGYTEYRSRRLNLVNTAAGTQRHTFGDDTGHTPTWKAYLDLGTTANGTISIDINSAPQRGTASVYPLDIIKGKAVKVFCKNGAVGCGDDQTASSDMTISEVVVDEGADVFLGKTVELLASATITVSGGVLRTDCDSQVTPSLVITQYGGTAYLGTPTLPLSALTSVHHGGKAFINATVTTLTIYTGGSVAEPEQIGDSGGSTITNCIMYAGATLINSFGQMTFSNGIDFYGCSPMDCKLKLPVHKTWTQSAI